MMLNRPGMMASPTMLAIVDDNSAFSFNTFFNRTYRIVSVATILTLLYMMKPAFSIELARVALAMATKIHVLALRDFDILLRAAKVRKELRLSE